MARRDKSWVLWIQRKVYYNLSPPSSDNGGEPDPRGDKEPTNLRGEKEPTTSSRSPKNRQLPVYASIPKNPSLKTSKCYIRRPVVSFLRPTKLYPKLSRAIQSNHFVVCREMLPLGFLGAARFCGNRSSPLGPSRSRRCGAPHGVPPNCAFRFALLLNSAFPESFFVGCAWRVLSAEDDFRMRYAQGKCLMYQGVPTAPLPLPLNRAPRYFFFPSPRQAAQDEGILFPQTL